MKLRTLTTAAVLASALTIAGTGVGQSAPAKPASVNYNAKLVGTSVVVTTDNGQFGEVKGKVPASTKELPASAVITPGATKVQGVTESMKSVKEVALRDKAGHVADRLPLTFTVDGVEFPLQQQISADKHTLTLTPQVDKTKLKPVAAATPDPLTALLSPLVQLVAPAQQAQPAAPAQQAAPAKPVQQAKPIASDAENSLAQANFTNQLGMATTVGSLVGTAVGVVAGIVLGGLAAGAVCLIPPFVTCILTALPIMATVAGVGGIAGTVLAGGGTLVTAGLDYVQTQQAAPGTTHYQADIDAKNAQLAQAQRNANGSSHR